MIHPFVQNLHNIGLLNKLPTRKGRGLAPTARLIPAQGIALGKIPHNHKG